MEHTQVDQDMEHTQVAQDAERIVETATNVAVIGCGPKALAIAAKSKVLQQLGFNAPNIHIFERNGVAAHWNGSCGFTDGQQTLGTPPEKDLGFPYKSTFGTAVDKAMLDLSWQSFLVDRSLFADWVDRGKKHPRHRQWAEYMLWACERINPTLHLSEVTAIRPKGNKIEVLHQQGVEPSCMEFDGIVLTGPGQPLKIHGSRHDWNEEIINGANFWRLYRIFEFMRGAKIAVIGSGETAASIIVALLDKAPELKIDLINRHGTIYTRGESFHENKFFSDADAWRALDPSDRDDFIRRTDRGVFSVASKKVIDEVDDSENITLITGNVHDIRSGGGKVKVVVRRQDNTTHQYEYDKVIVATGFDSLSAFSLLPDHLRAADKLKEIRNYIDFHLRIPDTSMSSLEDAPILNIHMPMLAAVAQGPGFPNLSCLGTVADRILSAYLKTED